MILASEQQLKKFHIKKPANSVFDWILTCATQICVLTYWWQLTFKWNVTGTKYILTDCSFCIINLNSELNMHEIIQENSAKTVFFTNTMPQWENTRSSENDLVNILLISNNSTGNSYISVDLSKNICSKKIPINMCCEEVIHPSF